MKQTRKLQLLESLVGTLCAERNARKWLDRNESNMTVVFNVFGEKDELIYRKTLLPIPQ